MFLDNLEQLMKERKWNKRTLARESGVPYTTIDGFYKKGSDNTKLSTLLKIASALDVSIDRLVGGEDFSVSEKEKKIICAYRNNPEMQGAVDKLLGVRESTKVVVYRAAYSEDRHPDGFEELTVDEYEKLKRAPDTDDDLM